MKVLMILFVACALGACASNGPARYAPVLPAEKLIDEYKIGVGDQLSVNVWKSPELSLALAVRPDGKISLPLTGDIEASGLSAPALAATITEKLKTYIRNPQVTIIVTSAGSVDYLLRVRVTGAINNPISIAHKDGMTVLDLVLEAGGPNEFASLNRAKLYRRLEGEIKVYDVRLNDILNKGKLETNYLLAPSDIVTVPERLF